MITEVLLNGLWQGALIVGIAACLTLLLPKRHAATRYAVWFTALIALAIIPALVSWLSLQSFASLSTPVIHTTSAASRVAENAASASGSWLIVLWLAGVAFFVLRLIGSYIRIQRIVRHASPATDLGSNVMLSHDIAIPIAARLFSPVILIPAAVAQSIDRDDLDSIVQHERAHIRRMDVAGNLLQRVIEAALFFNPWVYLIGWQLVKEREAACDDWAVQMQQNPDRYARCLAQLAQHARRTRTPLLTPSAIGPKNILIGRIARLLNGKVAQLKINYLAVGASIASFALLAFLLQAPQGLTAVASSCSSAHADSDAQALNPAPPDIPKAAYRAGLSAGALVTIAPNGHPISAKVVKSSGNAAVDKATIDAAMHSTYTPKMEACRAVTGTYYFHIQTGP